MIPSCNMSKHTVRLSNLRKGRNRHTQLRKVLSKAKSLSDIGKTYVNEVSKMIHQLIPTMSYNQRLIVKAEVQILNRRPDFVIYIPDKALILLEYKTTNQTIRVRPEYVTQTSDTLRKFKINHLNENGSTQSMKLISLLLIRNQAKRLNKVVCLNVEDMSCRRFYL